MLVAVASFDHCKVLFYELAYLEHNGVKKLVFSLKNERELSGIHKFPVKMVRMSKHLPNAMISCGDESDLFVKLWMASGSKSSEPVN